MTSNSLGTYDEVRQTVIPHLLVKVKSIRNLNEVMDSYGLQPYVKLELGNNSWETVVGSKSGEDFSWQETFQIDFEDNSNLTITLFDKDDYGSDTCIQSFTVPYFHYKNWKETTLLFFKVDKVESDDEEGKDKKFTTLNLKDEFENDECVLEIECSYMDVSYLSKLNATISNHRNIVKNKQAFTVYELEICRNDGLRWKVELRYSDFLQIRNEVSKILPSVEMLPFPSKTYFHWLSRLCTCASKFNDARIAERKKTLETFINVLLDNSSEFTCDSVTNLLRIPSPL